MMLENRLSRLIVTEDYRIILSDYDNLEIEMEPLHKAVYLLYLRHLEGIHSNEISMYWNELMDIYSNIIGCKNHENGWGDINNNISYDRYSFNRIYYCIEEALVNYLGSSIAKYYCIIKDGNEPEKIVLYRRLIRWIIPDKEIENRISAVLGYIKYMNLHPEKWEILRECCQNYYREKTLFDFAAPKFPKTIVEFSHALSLYNEYKQYLKKWNKDIAQNYSELWFPIVPDFMSEELFIDMSAPHLPIIIGAYYFDEHIIKIASPSAFSIRGLDKCQSTKLKMMGGVSFNELTCKFDDSWHKFYVEKYAEAWRLLDASIILPFLSKDFVYMSIYFLKTLNLMEYRSYLIEIFETIKRTGTIPAVEVALNSRGRWAVKLTQNNLVDFIDIEICHGRIRSACMMAF